MRFIYFHILLFISIACTAQHLEQAQQWADSSEFVIYEDLDLNQAQQLNKKAATIFKQFNHLEGQIQCQINTATIYAQKDSFHHCLELLNALESKIDSNHHLRGVWLTSKAWALWGIAQYEAAYQVAILACPILQQHKDWERLASASLLATYSIYYNNSSDFSTIDKHIDRTYKIARQHLPPSRLIFKYLYQLYGAILYQQGRIDQAIQITQQGLDYEYQLLNKNHFRKDSAIVAKYYSNLGRMYAENHDIEQGIIYYSNAFILYQELNNYAELIKLCTRIGELYQQKEENTAADLYFSKIPTYIPLLPKNPLIQKRENSFEHLAIAYYYQHFNLHDSIIAYYQNNIAYIKKHHLATDKAYLNIGTAYETKGDYSQAKFYYQKALYLTLQKYGQKGTKIAAIYFKLGHLAAEENDYPKAIAYMDSVILFLDESPQSEGDNIQLLEYLLDKSIAIEAYQKRGDVFVKRGEHNKAHADFNTIILLTNYLRDNYTNSESKLLSSNRLRPVYEKAAASAWQLYQNQQDSFYQLSIFDYAEHSKSALLNENILKFRNEYTQGGIGIPKELLQKEEKYIALIDRCKERIMEAQKGQNKPQKAHYLKKMLFLEQQLDSLEQFLQKTYPNYRSWDHGRDAVVSPLTVQAYLAEDELLIEYFISNNHFFIIYISSETVKIKEVPNFNSRHFKANLRRLRRSLSNVAFILAHKKEAYQTFCTTAYWFYHNFLEDKLLAHKKHLIIIPDRNLHYIPFEVLLTTPSGNNSKMDYQNLPYLIRKYTIHYEYSAAVMVNTQDQTNTSSGQILGFAASYGQQLDYKKLPKTIQAERTNDEVQLHNSVRPIPGAIEELTQISHRFSGDFFIDQEANEQAFKQHLAQNKYSVIHLAMHGIVDYNHPSYSSLMFTENLDSLEDNLLYSYEIQHLNGSHANLVVLSACKTGYGKYLQGEGIISLGRSFMYAGIPSIVMSLWELNDETSIQVMQSFYDNLAANQTKDQAMQQAKLTYLNNNNGFMAHPFFWASMIGIGNQQAILLNHAPTPWYWYPLGIFMLLSCYFLWRWFKGISR
ncbi:CHAT domain-containing protein [Aureispira anguillae]|nr:CHAT domain-containing tetratricopeptide repeat protein [Aureispira anguillae]